MAKKPSKRASDHCLRIYETHSELHLGDDQPQIFIEGPQSEHAKKRYEKIKLEFEHGFLDNVINEVKSQPLTLQLTDSNVAAELSDLVNAVTSEVGRAIVALTVMQLCIKHICPDQSIRLHKGATGQGRNFGWCEGLSMRSLDKHYVTPTLRKHNLLKLNNDGFMMTRTLAENYPYSRFYKAAIRGGRSHWLTVIEAIDSRKAEALPSLKSLIALLLNRTDNFLKLAKSTMKISAISAKKFDNAVDLVDFYLSLFTNSSYAARLFEIAIHSFFQALDEQKANPYILKPLCQMRSANKKHGNIADVELLFAKDKLSIAEAWDVKYGKSYLRDELEELSDKLENHPETRVAGFITDEDPLNRKEINTRKMEIEELHDVEISLCSFKEFIQLKTSSLDGESRKYLPQLWLTAFTESLCQQRREIAPIDEPCDAWVAELKQFLKHYADHK